MRIQNIQNIFNIKRQNKVQNPFATPFFAGFVPKERLEKDTFEKNNISFEGKNCSTSNFEVKFLYDINCPSCNKTMVTSNQLNSFIKNVDHKSGENLIKIIKRYDKYYHDTEKEVADKICNYAVENPKLNISEIVKALSIEHQENLVQEQNAILDQLRKEADTLEESEKEEYIAFINDSMEASRNFEDEKYFKRKTFLDNLSEIGKNLKDQENFDRIYEIACKLPTSANSANAFFIKYSRRGDEEIARRLLNPSLTTTEHVHPRSKEGENNTANYIAMCAECNSNRGSMPYLEWFKTHPDMPKNLQNYVNIIAERIKSKELRGYDSYLFEIIDTIERETDGKLKLQKPDMEAIEVSNASLELGKIKTKKPKKSYFEKLAKVIEGKKATLEELKRIAAQFKKDEEFLTLQKYYALIDEIDVLVAKKRGVSGELEIAKKEQRINDNRIKNLHNMEEQLKNETLKPKEQSDLKGKIKSLKSKIQPQEIPASKVQALDEDYKEITQEIEAKRIKLTEITSGLTLEDEYKQKEDELIAKLEERNKLRQRIYTLSKEIEDKDKILARKKQLEHILSSKKDYMAQSAEKNNAKEPDSTLLRKYDLLVRKLRIIDEIDPKTFCSNLKQPKGIKYSFILQEAKNSINQQLDDLRKHDIIKIHENNLETIELEKERKECNLRIKAIAKVEKTIEELTNKLDNLNLIQDERELNERLDLIRTRHFNLSEKIKYLDIDERIKDAIQTIKELELELKNKP